MFLRSLNKNLTSIIQVKQTSNLKIPNFLDVILNLSTGKYQPYNKRDNDPLHIDFNSNHQPNITKNFPNIMSKRINKLPTAQRIFVTTSWRTVVIKKKNQIPA